MKWLSFFNKKPNSQIETKKLFRELTDLIWNHAKFQDSNGISDKGYNINEVQELWNKYHKICEQFERLK